MFEIFVVNHGAAVKGIARIESVQARYPLMPKVAMSDMKQQLLKGSLDRGLWQQIVQGLCNSKVIHPAFFLALGTKHILHALCGNHDLWIKSWVALSICRCVNLLRLQSITLL